MKKILKIKKKNNNLKDKKNFEFLIEEIKKKDELIENLQKENKDLIKKIEEKLILLKKEINDFKKLIKQKFKLKEEEENNINNDNYDIINNKDEYEKMQINKKK